MNIQEAKNHIKESISIYLKKDKYGRYKIPINRQRPVFLIGAPGIGKTAVVEQIANEMDLLLVSYSMTHHTRQSAIGLPIIVHKKYGDEEFDISEYTLSEIIASVYEAMEKTGKKEGILFLDEINCVSETLGPSMLQFLQYKTFGNHAIPEGWVLVTAGNPVEYNRSVREFDYVTLDRLKVMEVEPDYEVWARYASERGIHRSIRSYLDIKTDDFYSVGMTSDGKNYVTARGWEDLSEAITLYEESGFEVNESLIIQYLRNPSVSSSFADFYALYNKYKSDYKIREILDGEDIPEVDKRAKNAALDERISVIELVVDAITPELIENIIKRDSIRFILPGLRGIKDKLSKDESLSAEEEIQNYINDINRETSIMMSVGGLEPKQRERRDLSVKLLKGAIDRVNQSFSFSDSAKFEEVSDYINSEVSGMKNDAVSISTHLKNAFDFLYRNFGDGNEMLIFMTELTLLPEANAFIAEYGSDEYFRFNKKFMLFEREQELKDKIEKLKNAESAQ